MPDYKQMYLSLFRSCTKTIELLQSAQREAEAIYISKEEAELELLPNPEMDAQIPVE